MNNDLPVPVQAHNDEQVIDLWLFPRGAHTQRAYRLDIRRFCECVNKPMCEWTLGDLQGFAAWFQEGHADRTYNRAMSAVKSILSFAKRIGYLQFDVGSAFELKKPRDVLVERRLEQREVLAMIDKTNCPRDQAYLRVLYSSGFRVSELCGLRWKDIIFRDDIALATAYGKGGKTRTVKISLASYHAITALRGNKADDALVIGLSTAQVTRMVKTAAKRAGIALPVSAHWMRHSHIFHAIENGCPLNEAQAQAGHSSLATTGRYLHANPRRGSSDYLAV